jgi:hypothetical protein
MVGLGKRQRPHSLNDLSHLEIFFENLNGHYDKTDFSPPELIYNCFAWAAGENHRPWLPIDIAPYHWPLGLPKKHTLKNFIRAYQTLGYRRCCHSRLVSGIEKIAIYVDDGIPTHGARQLENGMWTSKCGEEWEDIKHTTLQAIEGEEYGRVKVIMQRRRDGKPFLTERFFLLLRKLSPF